MGGMIISFYIIKEYNGYTNFHMQNFTSHLKWIKNINQQIQNSIETDS